MYQSAATHGQSKPASASAASGNNTGVLVVGPGIVLQGELGPCERLEVQGTLKADFRDTRDFVVAVGGEFSGSARVQTATIAGHLEGDLEVEGLLIIESTGRVAGNIKFGELQIARGGTMRGQVGISGG